MDVRVNPPMEIATLCTRLINELREHQPLQVPHIDYVTADPERLIEDGRDSAAQWLACGSDAVHPCIRFYARRSGSIAEVMMETLDDDDPHAMLALAASYSLVLNMADIDGYFMVCEAWVAAHGVDPNVNEIAPRDRSDRQEVVVVAAANRDKYLLRMFEIDRGFDGSVSIAAVDSRRRATIEFTNPLFTNLYDFATS